MNPILRMLAYIEHNAAKQNKVIYNIAKRNIGWAIMWFNGNNGEYVVYHYYPTFAKMIQAEYKYFKNIKEKK